MSGLTQRVITAFFFVAVMVGGIYGGEISFTILFAIVTAFCAWEFLNLTLPKQDGRDTTRKIIGVVLALFPYAVIALLKLDILPNPGRLILHSSLLISPFIFLTFIFELFSKSEKPFNNIAMLGLVIIYIGLPYAGLQFIAHSGNSYSPNIVMGLLLLTWINDTFAYFTGSKFGKNKLLPRISPKKTWEGTIGGVVGCILLAFILNQVFTDLALSQWIILAVIVSIFGGIGDLIESMLKRSVNVKDSGTILPGHGGFLDRFDAFIFLIPFALAYLLWQ